MFPEYSPNIPRTFPECSLRHQFLQPELYSRWQQHIVLDFSRVIGLDATAARSLSEIRCVTQRDSSCLSSDSAVTQHAGLQPRDWPGCHRGPLPLRNQVRDSA
jgi:hypothetical protein